MLSIDPIHVLQLLATFSKLRRANIFLDLFRRIPQRQGQARQVVKLRLPLLHGALHRLGCVLFRDSESVSKSPRSRLNTCTYLGLQHGPEKAGSFVGQGSGQG